MKGTKLRWYLFVLLHYYLSSLLAGCIDSDLPSLTGQPRPDPIAVTELKVTILGPLNSVQGLSWPSSGPSPSNQAAFKGPCDVHVILPAGTTTELLGIIGGLLTQRKGILEEVTLFLNQSALTLPDAMGRLTNVAKAFGLADSSAFVEFRKKLAEENPQAKAGRFRSVSIDIGGKLLLNLSVKSSPADSGWYPQAWIGLRPAEK